MRRTRCRERLALEQRRSTRATGAGSAAFASGKALTLHATDIRLDAIDHALPRLRVILAATILTRFAYHSRVSGRGASQILARRKQASVNQIEKDVTFLGMADEKSINCLRRFPANFDRFIKNRKHEFIISVLVRHLYQLDSKRKGRRAFIG
jgi:hypothetical protein